MRLLSSLSVFLLASFAYASGPVLDNLSDSEVEVIMEEFSSAFAHTMVAPARSHGSLFGFEVAVVAGATESSAIDQISKELDPDADFAHIPFAWIAGAVTVPYGITIEGNFVPTTEVSDVEFSHYSLGVKWSITDSVLTGLLPFDLAVRAYHSKSELEFTQNLSPVQFDVGYESNMTGFETIASWNLLMIEPYVGVGMVTSDAELSASSPNFPAQSIFDGGGQSRSNTVESLRMLAGVQFNLTLLKLGLEYNHMFDNSRYALKVGFGF